ncbi:TonB-dependent receptor [Kineobactrum salinum]|uniref:TonB-dependent receptor n=1 Tax=Kineobactrum salinum TaxID=2708301 RepID=A0A6C0U5A0_9GAMM|nr:TonB-dependent receptor [Kineobactrum salinum]QIB64624.1 TonB-dependent receptor [Kineobactrum salinum]
MLLQIARKPASPRSTGIRRLPLKPLTLALAALGTTLPATPALAVALEEVVVTAQKREQSLQDVGITMSAMSGDTLDSLGLYNSNQIAASIPNVNIESPAGEGGVSVLFIRGVGLNDFATNNSGPVGFYVDEVFAGSSNSQSAALFDIDRVEVLKGPQGTLYGRNTTGGAVSVYSRRPGNEFEGYIKGSYGWYSGGNDHYRLESAVGGPLGDTVNARLALVSEHSDGYMKNLINNDYVEKDNWATRGQLEWQPSERLGLLFNLHASDNDSDADLYNSSQDEDFYAGVSDIRPVIQVEQIGGSVRLDYALSDTVELVAISAWDEMDKLHQEDADMLPAPIIHTEYGVDAETFSQELRLIGGNAGSSWITGAYFLQEDLEQQQGVDLSGAGLPIPYHYDNSQELTTWALFGQYEYELTGALALIAGLRYTDLDVDFSSAGTGTLFVDSSVPGGISDSYRFADQLSEDSVSGKLGLNLQLNDDALLYASVSKGFKGAGFNGNFHINVDGIGSYDSEDLVAWELGFKSALLDGLMQFNAAVFHYDYSDAHIFNTAPIPGVGLPSNSIRNADASMQGLDADLVWTPIQGLYLQVGLGYVDATYDEDVDDPVTGVLEIDGNRVQNTPELSAFALLNYEWDLGSAGFVSAQLDASWSDDVYYSTFEDNAVAQQAYALTNARLSWRVPGDALEVALWGRNLADREYAAYVFDLRPDFGFLQRMRGEPRSMGIDVRYTF